MNRIAALVAVVALGTLAGCSGPSAAPAGTPGGVPAGPSATTPAATTAPSTASAPLGAPTAKEAARVTVDPEAFRMANGHLLQNEAGDLWCGVLTNPGDDKVAGCLANFKVAEVTCAQGLPLFAFRAGVEADVECDRDGLFINPNGDNVVLKDGQSVTFGTTTFTAERGGITLNGAPLQGGLHLSRSAGVQWAG